jgi:ribosomal protein S18 acetylase RimI-like enzyme
MSIIVRRADLGDPADGAGIVTVLDSYASDPFGGGAPLSDNVRATLIEKLAAQPNVLVLVALADQRYVGIAICFYGFSTFAAQPLLNVHDLAVLPDHRGGGIGRALLTEAERHARERGCCKLTLEVLDSNERARGLYRSVGFDDLTFGDSGPTRFLTKPLDA